MLKIVTILLASFTVAASPSPEKQDPQLWEALERVQHRFNMAALGVGGAWEADFFVAVGLGLAVADSLFPNNATIQRARPFKTLFILTGLGMVGVTQYLQAKDRHPSLDWRSLGRIKAENEIERREMWAIHRFFQYSIDDQYVFALADPELRDFVIDLDEWLRLDIVDVPPPLRPARIERMAPIRRRSAPGEPG